MEPAIIMAPGAQNNGFASMLATLLRQNIDERPEKRRAFMRMNGRVSIVVEDIPLSLTLVFRRGTMTVHDGIYGIPDATIRTDWELATKMSLVEILPRIGIPDPRGEVSKEVSAAQKSGTLRVHAAPSSALLMLRLTNVMSVAA